MAKWVELSRKLATIKAMEKQKVETIIIGAGIAGIACARQLAKHKKDFLVITEDIGGRILLSKNCRINYGAYFVLSNYRNVLPLVQKGEKLHPFLVEFHDKWKHYYHLIKIFKYPLQTLRLINLLLKFKSKYERFKRMSEDKIQKVLIESDPDLKKLYFQAADEFIREKKIYKIANKFLSEGVYMCTFLPLSQVSAFDFMRLCLGLISPAYEFTFLQEKAIKSFKNKIVMGTVSKIMNGKEYGVQTSRGKLYKGNNVVVATSPVIAKKLCGIKKIKSGSNAYVYHIQGKLKDQWERGQYELFESNSPVIFIRKQRDGSFIFYSKIAHPNLKDFFIKPRIIFKKNWEPAFNMIGNELLDCEQGKALYLIGDHNIIGLEDSYLTGLYAANKILLKAVKSSVK